MKILMLNYEFPPLGGGAGNATYYLLNEFQKYDNLQIDLITSSTNRYLEKQFARNIKIFFIDINKKNKNLHHQSLTNIITYSLKSFFLIKKIIKNSRYDLIHSFFGIPCGLIAQRFHLPFIVSLRGSDVPFYNDRFYLFDKLIFARLSKKNWRQSSAVIANSENLRALALKNSPRQKIEVITNGVDAVNFQPAVATTQSFTVISSARLTKRKGTSTLIAGFKQFHKKYPNSNLILVGDGELRKKMIRQVKNYQSAVHLLGRVNHAQMTKLYQKANAFALLSLNEGMSNSLLEAMACGLPVIVTDTGDSRQLIKDNGIIIEKNDSQALFQALEKLFLNKQASYQMGQQNRQRALQISWPTIAQKYHQLYEQISDHQCR